MRFIGASRKNHKYQREKRSKHITRLQPPLEVCERQKIFPILILNMRPTLAAALVLMAKAMPTFALTITAQLQEMSASDLLSQSILALGGANALAGLHGISYHT